MSSEARGATTGRAIVAEPTAVHRPSNDDVLRDFFASQRKIRAERTLAVEAAVPALQRLVECCANKTGQSQHLRALLFSLWNGQATPLINVLNLDWCLRQDFCAVVLAFGDDHFFYDHVSQAFAERGLLEWFIEQGEREAGSI